MSNEHPDPVVVGRYETEFEGMLIKNMLTEAGIPSEVVGGMTAGFRAETPGMVKVMVPGEYAERALELLIEDDEESRLRGEELDYEDDDED